MSQKKPRHRSEWLVIVCLVLVGGMVRLAATATLPRVAWGDEPFYLWLGQSLWSGDGFNIQGYSAANFPPLFAVLTGALNQLTHNLVQASNLVYIVAGAALAWPLSALARAIYSPAASWITGLIAALYPALVTGVLTWGTMTEPLYLLCIATAIYALFRALDDWPLRWQPFAGLGIALGLAYLTRTEALVFLAAAIALLLLGLPLQRRPLRPVLAHTGLVLVVFLLVASPYLLYIKRSTGQWSLTGAAGMAFDSMAGLTNNDAAAFDRATWGLAPQDDEVYLFSRSSEAEGLGSTLLADPLTLLHRLRRGYQTASGLLWSSKLVPWPLAALAALGLFARRWRGRRLRGELALLASLAAPLSYLPFFVQERYLAGMLPALMIWLGLGIWLLGGWLRGSVAGLSTRPLPLWLRRMLTVLPAVLLALLLLALSPQLWHTMQDTHSFQPGHLAAAAELKARGAGPSDVVMSRYPAIALHAGTRWAATPAEDWPTLLSYARRHQARYLVLDGWEGRLRPQLDFLLIPALAPAELRYLTTVETGEDPVVLYEFQ
ncbi:MAG: glycosyltransferase family 39 protein [Caldilineales bacterium]